MPGDSLVPSPYFCATRAITIEGSRGLSGPGWCRWDMTAPASMGTTLLRTLAASQVSIAQNRSSPHGSTRKRETCSRSARLLP